MPDFSERFILLVAQLLSNLTGGKLAADLSAGLVAGRDHDRTIQ